MHPPEPFPPPAPGSGGHATPARAAAALTRELTRHGITGIYTATAEKYAVISVTAVLTVWTNGHLFWCTRQGQRHTWPAADPATPRPASPPWPAPDGGPPRRGHHHR